MENRSRRRSRASAVLALGLAGLLLAPVVGEEAEAHPVQRFWRYGKDVRKHHWHNHLAKRRRHRRWHNRHPTYTRLEHRRLHHRRLIHRTRRKHRFRIVGRQSGRASWYGGRTGACGKPLRGLYAAHRSWPCGTKVSVRKGRRYVVVRVLDRGPHVPGRIIDVSRKAFSRLANPSVGTTDVTIYRLRKP